MPVPVMLSIGMTMLVLMCLQLVIMPMYFIVLRTTTM